MSTNHAIEEAVEVLQELGLKEYESKCFAGLARLPKGTAKELSEITDVPRTRVYDAIRVLEAQGLVEVQHTSPQQFRAVPLEEAMQTLRERYESRVQRLADSLRSMEPVEQPEEEQVIQEVWSLGGPEAVQARTRRLLEGASDEVVFVVGDPSLVTDDLAETLNDIDPTVDVFVGASSSEIEAMVESSVPRAKTFVSGLEWLHADPDSADNLRIGRLLLVDQNTILVSTIIPESGEEHAIFGTGFGNGLVVITRRLLSQGLIPAGRTDDDASKTD